MTDDRRSHWDQVYATRSETDVSWYQPHPAVSLRLIRTASPDRSASVIDVGGGASVLIDELVSSGFNDVSVLDISDEALSKANARLLAKAGEIDWIVADVTTWTPPRRWRIWHDRAVFHFLTRCDQQDDYIAALRAGTTDDATVVMATFALDGPEKCSGLPVQRYSAPMLADRLGNGFRLMSQEAETHLTPSGGQQRFTYVVLERVPARMNQ